MNEEPLKLAMKAIEVERAINGTWNQSCYMGGPIGTGVAVHAFAQGMEAYGDLGTRQNEWEVAEVGCETTMCLAGQIVHQAGFVPIIDRRGSNGQAWVCMDPETKEVVTIRRAAEKILDIGPAVGRVLFEDSARIDDVSHFKRYITAAIGVTFD